MNRLIWVLSFVFFLFAVNIFGVETFPEIKQSAGEDSSSIFGIGYVVLEPGYAELYSRTGIKWIKLPNVAWQRIEPDPPVDGGHKYNWRLLDRLIKEYQDHNFHIVIVLRAKSNWAGKSLLEPKYDLPGTGGGIATTPPNEEHWGDYYRWINAVVERYDADGRDDMPGIKFPVLYYEIESEIQHRGAWQGNIDEYLKLLETAYKAAKEANKETQIILAGINFADMFDDMPDQKTVDKRIELLKSRGRDDIDLITTSLREGKYDIVEFHFNRDYRGIYGIADFIRKYTPKPIWAADATSAPWLIAPASEEFNPLYKNGRELYDKIIANEKETTDWYRAEQAKLTTKKFVVGAEVGIKKIIMETTNQWPVPEGAAYFWLPWHLQNMVDKNKNPLPVFYTLKLLVEKLDGFTSVKRLESGKDIFAYLFDINGKAVYVFWAETGKKTIKLTINKNKSVITEIIKYAGESAPRKKEAPIDGSGVSLEIDSSPIFLE